MQRSFSELEYAPNEETTRRDRFLQELDAVVPWSALEQVIMPFYPTSGRRRRPTVGLTRMLRMYVAQQCFGLSDEGVEDAIYDSQAIRSFVGIDLSRESAPDATTLLDFRQQWALAEQALAPMSIESGGTSTVVDAKMRFVAQGGCWTPSSALAFRICDAALERGSFTRLTVSRSRPIPSSR